MTIKMPNLKILDFLKITEDKFNIAQELEPDVLNKIALDCIQGYEIDKNSCSEWYKQNDEAIKLAKQVATVKNTPWTDAANVKIPTITVAAIQFAARAYPEIVKGTSVVKTKVIGRDDDGEKERRALRISTHMNYQLLEEMEEWDEDMDRLLHILPIVGCLFKKTWFDKILQRNMSCFYMPDVVVVNANGKSLKTLRRISHRIYKYENDIYEMKTIGAYQEDFDPGPPPTKDGDIDTPYELIEQHCYLDLDEDGYKEPYIVTVCKENNQVARIIPRYREEDIEVLASSHKISMIKSVHYFTKYPFFPNPDGSFLDIGFGVLLQPLNESINTIVNQLLDAGTLSITAGGFIGRGVKLKSGEIYFKHGEWKVVDTLGDNLRQNIVPLPVREPSNVLFQLLGLLMESAKDISNVKDVMTGEKPGENVSTSTILALAEQGMKVYMGIYKRLFRALKEEIKKIYYLNGIHLTEGAYAGATGDPRAKEVYRSDYNSKDIGVVPEADPSMSFEIIKISRARALLELSGNNRPGISQDFVTKYAIKAIAPDEIEKAYVEPKDRPQPPPDPKMVKVQIEGQRMKLDADLHALERQSLMAKIMQNIAAHKKTLAETMKIIAETEMINKDHQLARYQAEIDKMNVMGNQYLQMMQMNQDAKKMEAENAATEQSGGGVQPDQSGVSDVEEGMGDSGGEEGTGGEEGGGGGGENASSE